MALWVICTLDHRHTMFVQVRRSDSALMPTLAAFKQTRAPEREPEATLARLCQGSYLEPQECVFKSAQRMVDPGVSGDK